MADAGKNAKTSHTGDGATTTFSIGFKFLDNAHVQVVVDGASAAEVEGTDYDIDTNGNNIVFRAGSIPPATTANNIVITRVSPREALYFDPTGGASLSEAQLEQLALQAIYLAGEVEDKI